MDRKTVIGVDLGGTNVRSGIVENNSVTESFSQKISAHADQEVVLSEVIDAISKVIDGSVKAIGIGVPSVVDVEKGIVYDVQNIPSWKEVRLKQILEEEFHIPVFVNNDANCFAAAEKYFGAAKDFNNIVGLIIGTGLGAGIYTNGKLYSGANCGAGEFGMIGYKDKNFEYYCSGQFFMNEYHTDGSKLAELADENDPEALSVFKEFGGHLGNAISAIIYSHDPEIIILGGSVSKSFKYFKNTVFKVLSEFPYKRSVGNLQISVSELADAGILGAAALYYEYMGQG